MVGRRGEWHGGSIELMRDGHPTGERIRNDIELVCEVHALAWRSKAALEACVHGAIRGNRDRALYRLAHAIAETLAVLHSRGEEADVFTLIAARESGPALSPLHRALLDFLCTMGDFAHFEVVSEQVSALADGTTTPIETTRALASLLHAYRVAYSPNERDRQDFERIRGFLATQSRSAIEDGDALMFWHREASVERWTKYETVLAAFSAYRQAQTERERGTLSLDALLEQGIDVSIDEAAAFQGERAPAWALEDIAKSPLNVLSSLERTLVAKLLANPAASLSWPRSVLPALAFSPAQASAIQLLRLGADAERVRAACDLSERPSYEVIVAQLGGITTTMEAALAILRTLSCPTHENPPAGSIRDADGRRMIDNLMRRKSFVELPKERLMAELVAIAPALHDVACQLRGIEKRWMRWLSDGGLRHVDTDRMLFSATLDRLYGEMRQ